MTKEQHDIYTKAVKRLVRQDVKDPTAQIVALEMEIDYYRERITGLLAELETTRAHLYDRGACEMCCLKRYFEYRMNLPDCNDCLHSAHNSCGFCPKPGEDVRINCPLWEPKKEEQNDAT